MTIKMQLLLAAALAVFAVTPALAQEGAPEGREGGPGKHFEKVDTDGDGFVTKDEMLAAHRARIDTMFEKADTDKDGKLSKEELRKGHAEMRGKIKERIQDRREKAKSDE